MISVQEGDAGFFDEEFLVNWTIPFGSGVDQMVDWIDLNVGWLLDAIRWPFRQSLMNHGVDLMGMGAHVSCVHSEADIDQTLDAFVAALAELRRDDVL